MVNFDIQVIVSVIEPGGDPSYSRLQLRSSEIGLDATFFKIFDIVLSKFYKLSADNFKTRGLNNVACSVHLDASDAKLSILNETGDSLIKDVLAYVHVTLR
jgi:hypothetical protein